MFLATYVRSIFLFLLRMCDRTCILMVLPMYACVFVSSEFCAAEAQCALSYNKPIFTLLPPVPEVERVTVNDIPPEHPLFSSICQRQVFDCTNHDLATFKKDLPRVCADHPMLACHAKKKNGVPELHVS